MFYLRLVTQKSILNLVKKQKDESETPTFAHFGLYLTRNICNSQRLNFNTISGISYQRASYYFWSNNGFFQSEKLTIKGSKRIVANHDNIVSHDKVYCLKYSFSVWFIILSFNRRQNLTLLFYFFCKTKSLEMSMTIAWIYKLRLLRFKE